MQEKKIDFLKVLDPTPPPPPNGVVPAGNQGSIPAGTAIFVRVTEGSY